MKSQSISSCVSDLPNILIRIQKCCKKICARLILVVLTATITIGAPSATYYKDKWVNVIAAECEPNCELESCLVSCDMYVSYKCHSELVYLNFTSDSMDRTYQAGDKLRVDRNNNDCKLELDDQTPPGSSFLYIFIGIGGLFLLLLVISLVGAMIFVYRRQLDDYGLELRPVAIHH